MHCIGGQWRIGTVLSLVLFILGLASASAAPSVIRINVGFEPDSLDPHVSATTSAGEIDLQLFTALTEFDVNGKISPGVAKSWEASPDGLTYTFHLRPDFTWSDGTPMTASDWVWSFQRLESPKTYSERAVFYYDVVNARAVSTKNADPATLGIRAIDPMTVEFRLEAPNPHFPELLAGFYPVPRKDFETYGAAWVKPEHFVGNGPYVLTGYSPHVRVDLARNPHYPSDRRPAYDTVIVYITPEAMSGLLRYRAGGLDIVALSSAEFARIPPEHQGELHIYPAANVTYLTLNPKSGPLSDMRVRKALSLTIDRDLIAHKVLGAGAVPMNLILYDAWTGLTGQKPPDDSMRPPTERTALAVNLLKAAGYGPSHRVQFTIMCSGEIAMRVCVQLQSTWKPLGVDVQIQTAEATGLFADLDAGDFDAAISGYAMGQQKDPLPSLAAFEDGGMFDFTHRALPVFNTAVDAARMEKDPMVRAAKVAEAEHILLSDWSIVPLVAQPGRYLIAPTVTGWNTHAAPVALRFFSPSRS